MFFDNNCKLHEHLAAQNDTYILGRMGLPVDVFHFKSKHKATDTFCQTHCNPAKFKELIGPDGSWLFNSSAAEQANAWFGGFRPIVREMGVARYNFFLDEVIAIRNRFTKDGLLRQGMAPFERNDWELRGMRMLV